MKRVLFCDVPTVHQSQLTSSSDVAFLSKNGHIGYIVYTNGYFRAISINRSQGNCNWDYNIYGKSIPEVIENLANNEQKQYRPSEIYLFENRSALYGWLSMQH